MNKEERKTYNDSYYKRNKDAILERLKERAECPACGRCIAKTQLVRHSASKFCFNRQLQKAKIAKQKETVDAIIAGTIPEIECDRPIYIQANDVKQILPNKRPRGRPRKIVAPVVDELKSLDNEVVAPLGAVMPPIKEAI